MGVMWALIGGAMFLSFIPLALDPEATLTYNGVPTSALGPKVSALIFLGLFCVAGIGLLFLPVRLLDRFTLWEESAWSFLKFWKR